MDVMENKFIIFFVILLLALILCSYLGGSNYIENYDNIGNNTYKSDDNSSAVITNNPNGSRTIKVTDKNNVIMEFTTSVGDISGIFYNPSGKTATITADSTKITVTSSDKQTKTEFTSTVKPASTPPTTTAPPSSSGYYDNYNHYTGSSHASIYYGPNGATARIVDTGNNNTLVITNKNGATDIYYIDNNINKRAYYGPNNSSAKIITGPDGKSAIEVTTAAGNKALYTETNMNTFSNRIMETFVNKSMDKKNKSESENVTGQPALKYDPNVYMKSLPAGVPKSEIPSGYEDLYILKSQVIPPVCPACPPPIVKGGNDSDGVFDVSKCPPCAPCARCPEPSFDCKKVPNYNAFNPSTMPVPVLNSFSTFGM
jgi:hypothetical protein